MFFFMRMRLNMLSTKWLNTKHQNTHRYWCHCFDRSNRECNQYDWLCWLSRRKKVSQEGQRNRMHRKHEENRRTTTIKRIAQTYPYEWTQQSLKIYARKKHTHTLTHLSRLCATHIWAELIILCGMRAEMRHRIRFFVFNLIKAKLISRSGILIRFASVYWKIVSESKPVLWCLVVLEWLELFFFFVNYIRKLTVANSPRPSLPTDHVSWFRFIECHLRLWFHLLFQSNEIYR